MSSVYKNRVSEQVRGDLPKIEISTKKEFVINDRMMT